MYSFDSPVQELFNACLISFNFFSFFFIEKFTKMVQSQTWKSRVTKTENLKKIIYKL